MGAGNRKITVPRIEGRVFKTFGPVAVDGLHHAVAAWHGWLESRDPAGGATVCKERVAGSPTGDRVVLCDPSVPTTVFWDANLFDHTAPIVIVSGGSGLAFNYCGGQKALWQAREWAAFAGDIGLRLKRFNATPSAMSTTTRGQSNVFVYSCTHICTPLWN